MTEAKALPIPPMTHDLKIAPEFFDDVDSGIKTFEVRRDDRHVRAGDLLHLREWSVADGYTGRVTTVEVTYLLRGGQFGIEPGFVVFGTRPVDV